MVHEDLRVLGDDVGDVGLARQFVVSLFRRDHGLEVALVGVLVLYGADGALEALLVEHLAPAVFHAGQQVAGQVHFIAGEISAAELLFVALGEEDLDGDAGALLVKGDGGGVQPEVAVAVVLIEDLQGLQVGVEVLRRVDLLGPVLELLDQLLVREAGGAFELHGRDPGLGALVHYDSEEAQRGRRVETHLVVGPRVDIAFLAVLIGDLDQVLADLQLFEIVPLLQRHLVLDGGLGQALGPRHGDLLDHRLFGDYVGDAHRHGGARRVRHLRGEGAAGQFLYVHRNLVHAAQRQYGLYVLRHEFLVVEAALLGLAGLYHGLGLEVDGAFRRGLGHFPGARGHGRRRNFYRGKRGRFGDRARHAGQVLGNGCGLGVCCEIEEREKQERVGEKFHHLP